VEKYGNQNARWDVEVKSSDEKDATFNLRQGIFHRSSLINKGGAGQIGAKNKWAQINGWYIPAGVKENRHDFCPMR